MATPWEYPAGFDNFPSKAFAKNKNKSDMNGDGVVDLEDVKLYAMKKVGPSWDEVDWCVEVFDIHKKYQELQEFIVYYFDCRVVVPASSLSTVPSDMNGDGVVDLEDVKLYATKKLGQSWDEVDWCVVGSDLHKKYRELQEFIVLYFDCLITQPVLSNPTVSQLDSPPTLGATIVSDGDAPLVERGTVWNMTGPPVAENPLAEGGTVGGTFSHERADLSEVPAGTTVYFAGYATNTVGTGYSPHSSFVIETPPPTVPALSNPVVSQTEIPATLGATIVSDGNAPVRERGTVWNTTGPPVTENALAEGGTELGAFSHGRQDLMNVPAGTTVYFCGYAVNDIGTGYSSIRSFAVKDTLAVKNAPAYPTRLALGPDDRLYVSDPKVKSIFIYDTNLQLTGELKDLDSPIGVAVDSSGAIYVGNTGNGTVEKYSSKGILTATIGAGSVRMPTDLTTDQGDNLYVADAQSNLVWVFRPDGTLLRTIRKGGLNFPIGVEIAYHDDGTGQMVGELYVADKKNYLVKVFDLQGNLLRSFGGMVEKGGMMGTTWYWKGNFLSLQSITMDAQGRLHALDLYMNKIQILNPATGAYIADYGEYGTGPGQLKLPLDIIVNSVGEVIVANAENRKVEIIYTVP
ncbi:NHL repeat-containing protein [Thermodesulfobacteriota bacterium]